MTEELKPGHQPGEIKGLEAMNPLQLMTLLRYWKRNADASMEVIQEQHARITHLEAENQRLQSKLETEQAARAGFEKGLKDEAERQRAEQDRVIVALRRVLVLHDEFARHNVHWYPLTGLDEKTKEALERTTEASKAAEERIRAEVLEGADIEQLAEAVHKAYCRFKREVRGEDYWTGGDYSKLDDEWKEADRYTVRAVLESLKKEGN